ncbi:MAG: alpha/beta hydrolase [Potamolinea sp.]
MNSNSEIHQFDFKIRTRENLNREALKMGKLGSVCDGTNVSNFPQTPTRSPQIIPSPPLLQNFSLRKLPAGLGIALVNLGLLLTPVVIPCPAQAAQQLYISYGPLEVSLPVASLELYAKEGKIDQELAFYTKYLNPTQLEQLRQILLTRIDVTPVAIAQFLYSSQGEIILERIGQIIVTKARQPGFYAIRAALIKSAAHPEGLTLLNVLREFPTYGIRINSERGFQIIEDLSKLVRQTGVAIAAVEKQAIAEASTQATARPSTRFTLRPDLRQPGPINYSKQSITINDVRRLRSLAVDVYLPTNPSGVLAPIIVISHGLGSDRETFAYLASHLASYGFAVAVPEHPGSNAEQLQAVIKGLANEVTAPTELTDRPLDIQFLLDELGRTFAGRMNLKQVGVIGQSFGGYTALTLAGAKMNFQQLQKDCGPTNNSLNLSLLLQCRAAELPNLPYDFQDKRIKAAIAINPVTSSIFGESQISKIQIPLMLVSSSDDTVAPALPEQIQPFTWLTNPNKYLILLKGGTHFSTLAQSSTGIPIPPSAIGPYPDVAQEYMKALSVAFLKTYVANDPEYKVYLNSSYAQFINKDTLSLRLVQSLTQNQLKQSSTPAPKPSPSPSPSPPPSTLPISFPKP